MKSSTTITIKSIPIDKFCMMLEYLCKKYRSLLKSGVVSNINKSITGDCSDVSTISLLWWDSTRTYVKSSLSYNSVTGDIDYSTFTNLRQNSHRVLFDIINYLNCDKEIVIAKRTTE